MDELTFLKTMGTIGAVKRTSLTVTVLLFAVLQISGTSCFSMATSAGAEASVLSLCPEDSGACNKAGCEEAGVSCWSGVHRDAYQSNRIGLTQSREDQLTVASVDNRSALNGLSLNLVTIPARIAPNCAQVVASTFHKSNSVLNL
jgi:hypothetical protein